MPPLSLPPRRGPAPATTDRLPHSQLTQHGPREIVGKLHDWCFALPGVVEGPSGISVPGSRALVLEPGVSGNPEAFMVGREFAHIHPSPDDGSMHLVLPEEEAVLVTQAGWGEDHYLVTQRRWPRGLLMVFSPRDEAELAVVQQIVLRAHRFATGSG